ncbi:PREDICTED: ubiquitin carboxyl-terminal hydrolase 32-like [Priapulus caudatus]|uniref:ubiquitinyl hydrolase 1 n=1 Tax=Priapulus caudatus TaxID=37621 RepID=A0ABM1ERB5_PRICU|nr:PREDICTED: ubiquitin carboxyl-terminal hydrolase 32-like [Priapulus caudatus]
MGAKDSKPCCITYEDAVKQVTASEFKRLQDAFKRASTLSGYMTQQTFVREVMGDGVPPKLAETASLNNEKVSYEDFHEWLQLHEDATAVTRWLLKEPTSVALTNDSETPTFYQTLAGVTHLEELDIIELEKRYWLLKGNSKTGKFDLDTFTPLVSPPVPSSVCKGFFDAFDENRDNHIDFKEMACGISACCRGPELERHKFCFKIFDADQANRLSRQQLVDMLSAMMAVEQESPYAEMPAGTEANASALADELLREYDANNGAYLSREDYLVWTLHRQLPNAFLRLLFQVCHVVLGLKPSCKDEEQEIISEWVAREDRRGMQKSYTAQSDNPNVVATNFTPVSRDDAASVSSMGSAETLVSTGGGGGGGGGVHSRSSSPALIAAAASPVFEVCLLSFQNGCLQLASSTSSASLPAATAVMRAPASIPQKPGAIDNTPLVVPNTQKVMMLTSEGGKLRRSPLLAPARDFQLVPEPVWKTLSQWYGGSPALPRTVIPSSVRNPIAELELHPISLRLLRHQAAAKPIGPVSWHGMAGSFAAVNMFADAPGYNPPAPVPPRRYLAYMAAFSRWTSVRQLYEFLCSRLRIRYEDMRLWKFMDENTMELLEEEEVNLVDLEIDDNQQILIEVRNKDLTWPEELSNLAKNRASRKLSGGGATERGATGLNNLGNTCFLNSALQCVSNTRPLTQYFKQNLHLYELNRCIRNDVYFLSSQKSRPSLFGFPLILPCHEYTTQQELYQCVWTQVGRLVSPLPPNEHGVLNHALDCDDSLGYEYPFILKAVQRDGFTCAWCPWFRFCRGCKIECCDADFCRASAYVAVDWDPTALHLRYQASLERVFVDHGSVEQSRRLQTEPIDLATCLQAFTKWEELGEDELYYCSKCRQHRLAQKKLDLWRLPPVLVIHLKRFQFVNGRWVKSHKIVKFPPRDLDPSSFLAPRARALSLSRANTIEETQLPNGNVHPQPDTSNLFQDQYYHWVHRGADTTTPNYDLYAIACHTGILGGGHYVCYAKNPNNKWYCYNDSSCKETTMEQVDGDSAYILFYERAGLGYERYQPDVSGLQPQCPDPESDFDSDYRKNCCVQ